MVAACLFWIIYMIYLEIEEIGLGLFHLQGKIKCWSLQFINDVSSPLQLLAYVGFPLSFFLSHDLQLYYNIS